MEKGNQIKFANGEGTSTDGIHIKLTEFLLACKTLKHVNLEVLVPQKLQTARKTDNNAESYRNITLRTY